MTNELKTSIRKTQNRTPTQLLPARSRETKTLAEWVKEVSLVSVICTVLSQTTAVLFRREKGEKKKEEKSEAQNANTGTTRGGRIPTQRHLMYCTVECAYKVLGTKVAGTGSIA